MHTQSTLVVNGTVKVAAAAQATELLIDYLRDTCGFRSVKRGCESTACGACTVLLDDRAVRSCSTVVAQAIGRQVTTLEGLSKNGRLHSLQRAFGEHHGLQCGFCTPGMIMALVALMREASNPSKAMIREAIAGNLCRCTGYQGIVEAAFAAGATAQDQVGGQDA